MGLRHLWVLALIVLSLLVSEVQSFVPLLLPPFSTLSSLSPPSNFMLPPLKLNSLISSPTLPRVSSLRPLVHSRTSLFMRHRCKVDILGLPADQRKALMRSMTTSLLRHGRIKTTLIRARAVRKHVEHQIELAKKGTLHARRQSFGYVLDKDLVNAMFAHAGERYGERPGGYTRVLKTFNRKGDNAKMAVIELV